MGLREANQRFSQAIRAVKAGEEVILMKDKEGRVIGFEKLNFVVAKPQSLRVAFETIAA